MMRSVDRLHGLIALLPLHLVGPRARRSFQSLRLRRLVRHAYETVPYYRSLFDEHGLSPADIQGLEDLQCIPVSTKQDLQVAGVEARISLPYRGAQWFERRTSGATGEPMVIRCTWWEESLVSCLRLKAFWRRGWRPWRRIARVQLRVAERRAPKWIARFQQSVLRNEGFVDCLLPPAEIADRLRRMQPYLISFLPGTALEVAEHVRPDDFPGLRLVHLGGETVTPEVIESVGRSFGVPVRQGYACHEFGQIAEQCPRSGLLHVLEEAVLLEVLCDGQAAGPGETGRAVGTALHSLGMPFLRYRLGDLVCVGPPSCSCGWKGMSLVSVAGRESDLLVLPDGRRLHVFAVVQVFGDAWDWIGRYQVVQERNNAVRLCLRPRRPPSAEEQTALKRRLQQVLGQGVDVELDLSGDIRREPSGKFRVCRSLVA